jgi:ubiquitin carboxyl-terminal hydrolase 4/11/15
MAERSSQDESTSQASSSSSTTPAETEQQMQNRILSEMVNGNPLLVEGQTYYLLATNWWNTWKKWSGFVSNERWHSYHHHYEMEKPKPGPIDNSVLLDDTEGEDVVRKGKTDNYDYVIITPQVWEKLLQWFGGGPPIARKCIRQMSYHSSVVVEVRKLKLKIIWSKKPKECIERWFSKAASVGEFIDTMAAELGYDKAKVRVYDFHNAKKLKLLDKMEKHLDEVQILDGQYMLIEESKHGKWPKDKIYNIWVQNYSYASRTPTPAGKTGLQNLGNTCFMNSAIQCLSLSVPIVDYFLKGDHEKEINEANPLGMKGQMARQYANLLRELWSSRTSVAVPRDFKSVIGTYAPQFTGYAQHDSHELLAFLLDGLHEDLNRIKQKPYVEIKDSDGRSDVEVANEAWSGYRKRNDSIIVDLFQGQLKSRLKCPVNARLSNQFDPYMYLSVPLPMKSSRKIILTFYPLDLTKPPTKYGFSVEKFLSIWDLKVVMGNQLKLPPQSFMIFDVFSSRFHREFKNHEDVSDIKDNDIVAAYEVYSTNMDVPFHKKQKSTPSVEREPEQQPTKKRIYIQTRDEEYGSRTASGIPFAISVDNQITYRQLYNEILNYMKARNHVSSVPEDSTDIFKLVLNTVSSFSNYSNTKPLHDNDKTLDLGDKDTVACEFNRENRRKYYNDHIDEKIVIDDSSRVVNDAGGKDSISLYDCLRLFTSEEQLSSDDAWYCSECKEFREAYKKFDIWSAPKLLVVQLKRFSAGRYSRERLDNLVDFPIDNLDLRDFVIGPVEHPPIYDLYAVSNHFGGMGGGHYTAFGRHRDDNQWYRYDDSSVSQANRNEIVSRAAYVLFYKRKDVPWTAFDPALDQEQEESSEETDSSSDEMDTTESQQTTTNATSTNEDNREGNSRMDVS